MIPRFCIEPDLEQIEVILELQDHMYGVKLDVEKQKLFKRLSEIITTGRKGAGVVGVFDGEVLVGFAAMILFSKQPFWRVTMMFFGPQASSRPGLMIQTGAYLFKFMTSYAERQEYFTFFYVVRDSGQRRFKLSMEAAPEIARRYDIVDLKVVQPGEVPDLEFYRQLLGFTCGRNLKPIVIRQGFLRGEFRRDPWT